jgi:hypothetical protein
MVKHLDVRALWLQAERRDFGLIAKKVLDEENLADLGTRAHPVARFKKLRDMCGIVGCSKVDEHKEIKAMAVEIFEDAGVATITRRGTRTTSLQAERALLPAFLAAAPMAGHACDGEEEKLDFVKIATTVLCIVYVLHWALGEGRRWRVRVAWA